MSTVNHPVEELTPIDPEKVLGVDGANKSKIFEREREILATKLDGDGAQPIPFKALTWGDNVRSVNTLALESMVHSLKQRGYNPKYPIVVSKRGKQFLVLCGNRRTEALKMISESEPEVFKVILPDGKIPALVLSDLTEEEEKIIRIDHSSDEDRVGLDEEGLFYAVRQLLETSFSSQADIASKLNQFIQDTTTGQMIPNRSFIQPRVNLAKLPKEVQEEFVRMMRDKRASNVKWGQVATLYRLYNAGRKKGFVDGGPEFIDHWQKCLNPVADDSEITEKAKMLTKKELETVSNRLGSRLGQLVLLKIANGTAIDPETKKVLEWTDLDGELIRSEQALSDLVDIANHLGKDKFQKMMAEIAKKKQAEEKKQAAEDKVSH